MRRLSEKNPIVIPHLVVDFNKEWELKNWYIACTKKSDYGLLRDDSWFRGLPEDAVLAAKRAKNEEGGIAALRPIFENFIETSEAKRIVEDSIARAKREWKNHETKFFQALSAMLDIKAERFEKEYHAHLTFTRRCPFSKNEFMFSRFGRIENVATHEIMHIEFLKAYGQYCKNHGLTDSEIQHLKEILTVLLNEDEAISKLRSAQDQGYTKHEKIRKEVAALYRKHKTNKTHFTEFLDEVIFLVKAAGF